MPVSPDNAITATGSNLLQFIGQAAVVILGWLVVHRLSLARDRERAKRDMLSRSVDTINGQLNELLEMAHEYHTAMRNVGREQRILMSIQDVALSISGLKALSDATQVSPCMTAVRRVREAITSEHFADEHTGPIPDGDKLLEGMAGAILHAKRSLINLKHQQFPT